MSPVLSLIIIAEVLFTLFIVWGFMHEEKFVAFEDKIIFAVLKKIRRTKALRESARRERLNEKVYYTPVKPESSRQLQSDTAA
ncbi:MAG: hypothetical protein IKB08_03515 [Clostridia bacterium]|nr:hypothetical protein [Oscillospiraceae bacterium]MBR2410773.1 hypothetical protein [Clostridia bacterium]